MSPFTMIDSRCSSVVLFWVRYFRKESQSFQRKKNFNFFHLTQILDCADSGGTMAASPTGLIWLQNCSTVKGGTTVSIIYIQSLSQTTLDPRIFGVMKTDIERWVFLGGAAA